MNYIYIALKSRQEAVFLAGEFRSRGVDAALVSTPKGIGSGCGMSVKVNAVYRSFVKKAVNYYRPKSLKGLFLIKTVGSKNVITPM